MGLEYFSGGCGGPGLAGGCGGPVEGTGLAGCCGGLVEGTGLAAEGTAGGCGRPVEVGVRPVEYGVGLVLGFGFATTGSFKVSAVLASGTGSGVLFHLGKGGWTTFSYM